MSHTLAFIFLLGGVYALFAFGAALKYGASGRFDLSHAALFAVSAGTCAAAFSHGVPPWLALLEGTLAGALAGLCVDRFVLWPLGVRGGILGANGAIVGAAAAFAILLLPPTPVAFTAGMKEHFLSVHAANDDFAPWIGGAICLGLLLLGAVLVRSTRLGSGVRAAAGNAEAARAAGVDLELLIAQNAFLTSGLAAIAGIVLAICMPAWTVTTTVLCIPVLAACIIGGIDSPSGAVLVAYVLAIVQVAIGTVALHAPTKLVFGGTLPIAIIALLFSLVAPRGLKGTGSLRNASSQ